MSTSESPYLNALPSAVIAVDHTLAIRYLNPAAEMLVGISAQAARERNLSLVAGFDGELSRLCARVIRTGESISLYDHQLKLPMNYRSVTIHISPVMLDSSAQTQALLTIEKSEGRERVASQELKQEASRAAGVMAAMLAHEVKNPLAGIRGAAQLLRDEVAPEHQPLTELICMECDRINDLLSQVEIFDGSAAQAGQSVNIHEVLQYVISIARSGFAQGVTFRERYDPSLPPVSGQRDLLVQLLLNLVKNAAEALAGIENPTITFSTAYRSGYRLRSHSEQSVPLPVMLAVEDNGAGIPAEIRARLFEPFVSSKENGRGLGLAIVAKIAGDLGAAVELDPEHASGTRFVLWLAVDNGRNI